MAGTGSMPEQAGRSCARCYAAAMMFKAVVLIAIGVVVGYVLGGVAPRRELQAVRSDRDALRMEVAHASRPNLLQALLPRIGSIAPDARREVAASSAREVGAHALRPDAGENEARPAATGDVVVIGGEPVRDPIAVPTPLEVDGRPSAQAPAQAVAASQENDRDDATDEDPRGRGLLGRFGQLVTVQRARTAAARSALIAQAGLDDAQIARVDTSVQKMNAKLAGYGEEVIAQAASEEPPSPAQALGLGHDVSGILYEGQKELDSVVGAKNDAIDPSALEIWSYVDLEQWKPYVEEQLAKKPAK